MLLIDGAHQRGSRWQDLVNEDEDSLLGAQLYPLANDVDELADSEIGGHEVLLLVNSGDVRSRDLLANDLFKEARLVKIVINFIRSQIKAAIRFENTYWNTVRVLLANALGLSLSLIERVIVLELGTHGDASFVRCIVSSVIDA